MTDGQRGEVGGGGGRWRGVDDDYPPERGRDEGWLFRSWKKVVGVFVLL